MDNHDYLNRKCEELEKQEGESVPCPRGGGRIDVDRVAGGDRWWNQAATQKHVDGCLQTR